MKLVITRTSDGIPFYSFVFPSKEHAARNLHRQSEVVVKTTKAFGDPEDGYMISTCFGWREENMMGIL